MDVAASAPSSEAPLSILLVDDDEFVREATESVLENAMGGERMRVDVAGDGEEGLQMLTSGGSAYDLVLMDAQMPFMDGFACIERVRAWEQAQAHDGGAPPRMRVVVVSGNAEDPGFHENALASGFDDAIAKPLTMAHARGLLRRGV